MMVIFFFIFIYLCNNYVLKILLFLNFFFFALKCFFRILNFLTGIIKLFRKKTKAWTEAYECNNFYTYIDFFKNDFKKFSIKRVFFFCVTFLIHQIILFIQIFIFLDFFFLYIFCFIKNFEKKTNFFWYTLLIWKPKEKAYFLSKKIKKKSFSKNEIKSILVNFFFIYSWGKSRWFINNCIIVTEFLEKYYKTKQKKRNPYSIFKTIVKEFFFK